MSEVTYLVPEFDAVALGRVLEELRSECRRDKLGVTAQLVDHVCKIDTHRLTHVYYVLS